jgi:L-ascorbate metabolism protein UlaG (beta-lactamase superfamily)
MGDAATERTVGLRWLGQSGFELTAADGQSVLLDPYLSDWALEDIGTPRAIAPVVEPGDVRTSAVIATHYHHDHLDVLACPEIARRNPDAVFIGPPSIHARLVGRGVAPERVICLERDGTVTHGAFTIRGGFVRHEVPGWLTEDALSLAIEVDGVRIFVSGDTEYDSRVLAAARYGPFDVGLFVTNGSGGNMNALEAALMAHRLGPALAVPMHYGMWPDEYYGPDATLDPQLFVDACRRLGGPATHVMELGGVLSLPADRTAVPAAR